MDNQELEIIIQKLALQNAYKYGKVPQVGAVTGKLLGTHSELKPRAKELMPIVKKVLEDIELMSPEEVKLKLQSIAPELIEELLVKKEVRRGLPELDISKVQPGQKVTLRIAPNPNGPPSLGNARGIIVNQEYARMYDGKFIMRFDDTDPLIKKPMLEAYRWYVEQATWLGCPPDEVYIASDRIPMYYEYAEKLIELGKAYVCFCSGETFSELKDAGKACPHRDASPEENMKNWKAMLNGDFEEKVVLRIKTDITHKDPALRDYVAFRIVREEHPRTGHKYLVWPMLDFESAMEDHFLGVTHIIRGKDLIKTADKQRYIYKYLGWAYPARQPLGPRPAPRVREILDQRHEKRNSSRRIYRLGRPEAAHGRSAKAKRIRAGSHPQCHDQHGRYGNRHRVQHGHAVCGEPQAYRPEG